MRTDSPNAKYSLITTSVMTRGLKSGCSPGAERHVDFAVRYSVKTVCLFNVYAHVFEVANVTFLLSTVEEKCWESKYGCCPDHKTLADGPRQAGCGGKS